MRLARFLGGGLFLGLQNLSLSAIGPRHIKVSFGDFDIAGGSRHALSLVRLLTEELGFLHHRPTPGRKAPARTRRAGEVFARAPVNIPDAERNHTSERARRELR